jgi:hypothetical protein
MLQAPFVRYLLAIVVMSLSSPFACASPGTTSSKTKVAPTKPVPALGEMTTLGCQGLSFSIRPPKGYQLDVSSDPQGSAVFGWHSKPRADNSAATFTIMPVTRPTDGSPLTLDGFITAWFESGKQRSPGMDMTSPVTMNVNGRPFRYVTYRRIHNGYQYNGFFAATEVKLGLFAVSAEDAASATGKSPYLDASMASLRTFKTEM